MNIPTRAACLDTNTPPTLQDMGQINHMPCLISYYRFLNFNAQGILKGNSLRKCSMWHVLSYIKKYIQYMIYKT